jgi:hypothetical protein
MRPQRLPFFSDCLWHLVAPGDIGDIMVAEAGRWADGEYRRKASDGALTRGPKTYLHQRQLRNYRGTQ